MLFSECLQNIQIGHKQKPGCFVTFVDDDIACMHWLVVFTFSSFLLPLHCQYLSCLSTLSIFGYNEKTIRGEIWLPIYVQLSSSHESSEKYTQSSISDPFFWAIIQSPRPILKLLRWCFIRRVRVRRPGWFWQNLVFKEKHSQHKVWKIALLRAPSSNSFFYYGQKVERGCIHSHILASFVWLL